jgi:hypothetical protein
LPAIWHKRRKKGSQETVIDDRQFMAARAIEYLIDVITNPGPLRSADLTVPVVDMSFKHRLGGSQDYRFAFHLYTLLIKRMGKRDASYLVNCLFGMGPEGAMLYEAGLPWRDRPDADQRTGSRAAEIREKGHPYKITPVFANPSRLESGSFGVEDRRTLQEKGRAGSIYSKHELPNENGFAVDDATEIEKTAKAAARRVVADNKADIEREAQRDELDDIRGSNDPKLKARQEELESLDDLVGVLAIVAKALHSSRHPDEDVDPATEAMREMNRRNPPPDMRGHREIADMNSIGSTIDVADMPEVVTTRQRAIEAFGMRGVELGRQRCRALLGVAADIFEEKAAGNENYNPVVVPEPAQITRRGDIVPFDVENLRVLEPSLI